jgi:hypothetical protein
VELPVNHNRATSIITIQSGSSINFASTFTATGLSFNGYTRLNGTRLWLTDGAQSEASRAWCTTAVNVQTFTTDFRFQLTNPNADGMTFTIQNAGTTALGPSAVKFDLFQNSHEGNNSTGLYTNGVSPTSPAVMLGGVNLHSGDIFRVHITYDGTTLTMTVTDTVTNATLVETRLSSASLPVPVGRPPHRKSSRGPMVRDHAVRKQAWLDSSTRLSHPAAYARVTNQFDLSSCIRYSYEAGWSSLVARRAHNAS